MIVRISVFMMVLALVETPVISLGHEDIDVQIAALSERIQSDPDDLALLFRRAELYRYHQDWEKALADFDRILRHNPKEANATRARAALLVEAGRREEAFAAINQVLEHNPEDAEALMIRARIQASQNRFAAAAADYRHALSRSAAPSVELYVELAQALLASGKDHAGEAIQCLDEGVAKLGPVPVLQQRALEIELAGKHYDRALARIDAMAKLSSRKEGWLIRRGEVLELAGRRAEAGKAYQEAEACLRQLPDYVQARPATQQLLKQAQAGIERTSGVE